MKSQLGALLFLSGSAGCNMPISSIASVSCYISMQVLQHLLKPCLQDKRVSCSPCSYVGFCILMCQHGLCTLSYLPGRAYAALDGDISPMHLYKATAMLMGFPSPVANVHFLAARTEATIDMTVGEWRQEPMLCAWTEPDSLCCVKQSRFLGGCQQEWLVA